MLTNSFSYWRSLKKEHFLPPVCGSMNCLWSSPVTINWRSAGWIWLAEPSDSVRNRIKKLWGSKRKYHAVPINNPSYPSSLAKHVEGRVAAVFLLFYGVLWWILPTNFLVKKNVHSKVIIEIILNKGKYPDTAGFQCTFFITWWTTFKQIEQCFLFSYWNQKYVYIYCHFLCTDLLRLV